MKKPTTARRIRQSRPDANEIFATWVKAYDDGDVSSLMSIFDPTLRYRAPCEPEQTFESLSSWYKYDFARKGPRPSWTFQIDSVDAGADLAVIVSTWSAVTNFNGFSADLQRLRSIDLLRLGDDGWKIFRTINDSLPCGGPIKSTKAKSPRNRGRKAR